MSNKIKIFIVTILVFTNCAPRVKLASFYLYSKFKPGIVPLSITIKEINDKRCERGKREDRYELSPTDMIKEYIFLDFSFNNVFKEVFLDGNKSELSLEGDLLEFRHELGDKWTFAFFVPFYFLGAPAGRVISSVKLDIRLICNKNNEIIKEYSLYEYIRKWHGLYYNFHAMNYEYQLSFILRELIDQLKENIENDKEEIISNC